MAELDPEDIGPPGSTDAPDEDAGPPGSTDAPVPSGSGTSGTSDADLLFAPGKSIVTPDEKRQQERDDQNQKLGALFDVGLGFKGGLEKHAGVMKLAEETGTDPSIVEKNYDEFKRTYELAKFDPQAWRDANPELAAAVLNHPEAHHILKDEEAQWLVRAIRRVTDTFEDVNDAFVGATTGEAKGTAGNLIGKYTKAALTPVVPYFPDISDANPEAHAAAREERDRPKQVDETETASTKDVGENAKILIPLLRYKEAARQNDITKLGFEHMMASMSGSDTYEVDKQILALEQGDSETPGARAAFGETGITKFAADRATDAAGLAEPLKEAGFFGGLAGLVAGAVGEDVGGPELGSAAAKSALNFFGKAGMAEATFRSETGGEYLRLRKALRADPSLRMTDEQLYGASLMYGSLSSMVQLGMMHELGKGFAPMLGQERFAGLLRDKGFLAIAGRLGNNWVKEGATVGGQGAVADALQQSITYLATRKAGAPEKPWSQVVNTNETQEAATNFATLGLTFGAVHAVVGLHGELIRDNQSAKAGQVVQALTQLADTPSTKAAPEVVAKAIEDATTKSGMPVKSLYVDAPAFVRLFQEHHVNPDDAATHLMGADGPAKLKTALDTGGKIEVSTADYLEKWGHTDAAHALAEHTTTSPHFITDAERLARDESIQKRADEIVKENGPAKSLAEQDLHDRLTAQAVANGYTPEEARTATFPLVANRRALAEHFPHLSEDELFRNHEVNIATPEGEAVPPPLPDADTLDVLTEKAKAATVEQRSQKLFVDSNTGLPNEKAFREAHPTGPVGHVSVEGIKFLNDNADHSVADRLYRATARALEQVAPGNVFKVGGDFVVPGVDQAQLDVLLEKARINMPPEARGFALTGVAGPNLEAAETAHTALKTAEEAAGRRAMPRPPQTGEKKLPAQRPMGFQGEAKDLVLPEERAAGKVPAALHERVSKLTPEQYFKEQYVTPEGLLTSEGAADAPRKKNSAMVDVKGLREANERFGKETGDRMLHAVAMASRMLGGVEFQAAHLHGDEFSFGHNDPHKLEAFLSQVDQHLESNPLEYTDPETGEVYDIHVHFRHGIGRTLEAADRDLNERKAAEVNQPRRLHGGAGEEGPFGTEGQTSLDVRRRRRSGPEDVGRTAPGGDAALAREANLGERPDSDAVALRQAALKKVSAMRPYNRAVATKFLDYIDGKTDVRPVIEPRLERLLAEFGQVDPKGYAFDENNRSMEKRTPGARTKGNAQSENLVRFKHYGATNAEVAKIARSSKRRLAQFPTPEESQKAMQALTVFLDQMREKGAKPVPESEPGKVDFALPVPKGNGRFGALQAGELMLRNDEESERVGLNRIVEVGRRNNDQAGRLQDNPGGTNPLANPGQPDLYESTQNRNVKSIPESKNLPGQAELEDFLNKVNASKTRLFQGEDPRLRAIQDRAAAMIQKALKGERPSKQEIADLERSFSLLRQKRPLGFPSAQESLKRLQEEAIVRDVLREKGVDLAKSAPMHVMPSGRETGMFELGTPQLSAAMEWIDASRAAGFDATQEGQPTPEMVQQWHEDTVEQHRIYGNDDFIKDLDKSFKEAGGAKAISRVLTALWNNLDHDSPQNEHWADNLDLELDNEYATAGPGSMADENVPVPRPKGWVDEQQRKGLEQNISRFEQSENGYTDIAKEGLKKVFNIVLTPNANKSTLLHESAHVFLEMFSDLAEREDAPERLKQHWQATLDAFGAKDRAEMLEREKHEKFARSFEAYYLEGKEPSRALAGPFTRFRLWLKGIYRTVETLQGLGAAPISKEIRDVFDRLLATDDEIADQQSKTPPLFSSPVQAGLEGEEWQKYLDERLLATSHAQMVSDRRVAKDQLRETESWWKGEEKKLRTSAAARYEELPEAKAKAMLEQGKSEQIADIVAEANGFPSTEKMLEAVAALKPKDAWAREQAALEMTAKHPDVLNDKERLREVVSRPLHGDFSADVLLREMSLLRGKVPTRLWRRLGMHPVESVKLAAADIVSKRSLSSLSESEALRDERVAANRAVRAVAKGDFEQAFVQKQQQLLNQFIVAEVRKAADFRDKFEELGKRLSKPAAQGQLGLADPSYRDTVNQVLGALKMGPETKGNSLDVAIAKAAADAQQTDFDIDQVRDVLANPRAWDKLTYSEAQSMHDALKNLNHIATLTNDLTFEGKKMGRQMFIQSVAERVASVRPPEPLKPYSRTARGVGTTARHLKNAGAAFLEDIETVAERMDGATEGPMHDLLINSRIEARTHEVELSQSVLKPIAEAWEKVPKEIRNNRKKLVDLSTLLPVPNPETHSSVYTRDQLWMLFLNAGNEGNLNRLEKGNGWTRENIAKALEMLTPQEADFLQSVLDSIQTLWPEIKKVHEQRTGLELQQVKSTPIVVGGKTYRGGYFPLRYDPEGSYVGEKQELNDVKDLNAPRNYRPATSKGYTKARVESLGEPVRLDWGVVPSHFAQVTRDLAYGEWVRQTGSVLLDPKFRDVAKRYLGTEQEKELVPWLRDVANARADSAAGHQSDIATAIGPAIRSRIAIGAMGLNLPSLARHTMDPFSTFVDSKSVPLHRISAAYLKVMNPAGWGWEGYGASKEIAFHDSKLVDNLKLELAKIGPKYGLTEKASQVLFSAHAMVDHFTTRVIFRAAFDHAKGEGLDDEAAAKQADGILRRAIPSGDIAEKPPVLRTKSGWASAIMFYGYASKMYNLRARLYDTAVRDMYQAGEGATLKKAGIITKAAGMMLALGAIGSMGKFLAGRGPKKSEDPLEWLAGDATLAPLDDIPAVGRPAAEVAWQLVSGEKGREVSIASAPELAFVQQILTNLQRAGQKAEEDGDETAMEAVLEKAGALLMAVGPAAQVHRTAGFVKAAQAGDVDVRNPADLVSGLLYGTRKNPEDQPRNPFSVVGDALAGE